MRWSWCGCNIRFLVRLDRLPWMRLVPGRRRYYCSMCEADQFLARDSVRKSIPLGTASNLHCSETMRGPLG
ncbi:hypothetical protein GCM10028796_56900 [Ramlibacter monticola]